MQLICMFVCCMYVNVFANNIFKANPNPQSLFRHDMKKFILNCTYLQNAHW